MTDVDEYQFPLEAPGNEFDDDANTGDQWRTTCCGADYDCICD